MKLIVSNDLVGMETADFAPKIDSLSMENRCTINI